MVRGAYEIWISGREQLRKVNGEMLIRLMMQCRAQKLTPRTTLRLLGGWAYFAGKNGL